MTSPNKRPPRVSWAELEELLQLLSQAAALLDTELEYADDYPDEIVDPQVLERANQAEGLVSTRYGAFRFEIPRVRAHTPCSHVRPHRRARAYTQGVGG